MLPRVLCDRPLVLQLTAPNSGPKTLTGTHTYIVGREDAVLIDPGPALPSHLVAVRTALRGLGVRVGDIILTHSHPDHAEGAGELAQLLAAPVRAWVPERPGTTLEPPWERRAIDGQKVYLTAHSTPGHTPDSICLLLHPTNMLFTGDTLLGGSSTLIAPPEGDIDAYLESLGYLLELLPSTIAPGHGEVTVDAASAIHQALVHRAERRRSIVVALQRAPRTAAEIVEEVYGDVSPDKLDLALLSVEAQLSGLVHRGQVRQTRGVYQLVDAGLGGSPYPSSPGNR